VLQCPTALFESFFGEDIEDIAALASLRKISFGGEAVSAEVVHRWSNGPLGRIALLNTYGPTETVITATAYQIDQGWQWHERVPIGPCLPGHQARILDADGNEASQGELYLGGPCVARGYLNRPDLTAERFVQLPSGRYYRTGDIVAVVNGQLVFLGRADRQVKLRGYRIELDEVEHGLRGLDEIQNAVVALEEDRPGHKVLVAYVVARVDDLDFAERVRKLVAQKLPKYMVPDVVHVLSELPVTVTGKIDRKLVAEGAAGVIGLAD
jgi:acyl-coenzyme A synthetase/AMP-(fatty) acid ligase